MAVPDEDVQLKLCSEFKVFENELDYLVIDTAAGIAPIVTGFVERADLAVIVINDEPASFIDGYGLLKALAARGRCRSEEHTSELQSLMRISYAVFCLKKKRTQNDYN